MIRYLERQGYDVEYVSDVDVYSSPHLLEGHHGVLLAGHSEYWAKAMRDNLAAAVSSGVNLANFAANSIYWQIRFVEHGKALPRGSARVVLTVPLRWLA